MKISFYKYQGTGNDFVMLDNLNGNYDSLTIDQIRFMCDRRFGVGADGLIKINRHEVYDFEVDYYNSDGSKSFCGNGARCAVAFAKELGVDVENTVFNAIDGVHEAKLIGDLIYLKMNDLFSVNESNNSYIANTGSPHFMTFVDDVDQFDIVSYGKEVRYSEVYKKEGINVNVIEELDQNAIRIRTYERGVEDETLSCGTGATACAIAFAEKQHKAGLQEYDVKVQGGDLKVRFNRSEKGSFTEVELIGPAVFVFKGEIDV